MDCGPWTLDHGLLNMMDYDGWQIEYEVQNDGGIWSMGQGRGPSSAGYGIWLSWVYAGSFSSKGDGEEAKKLEHARFHDKMAETAM